MEFKYPLLAMLGIIAALIWSLDYWKAFAKVRLALPPQKNNSQIKQILRFIFFLVGLSAWGFISFSLTQPRLPQKYNPSNIQVNDVIFSIDVSRSMLAEDLTPNRLEVAKEKIREFVRLRPTDRIAVITFAEKVLTLLPLTTDPTLADKVLSDISIGYLGSGTNIGDGLGLAVARAVDSETKNKVVILLTDGVANVGTMTPLEAAEEARKNGIKVYTIGLGGDGDAKIPIGNGFFGTQYALIPGGSIDYKVLQEISNLTGGKFYPAKSEKALQEIFDDIQNLEKTHIEVNHQVVYDEKYYPYLAIGLGLLCLSGLARRFVLKDLV
ncbi:MAG TPA: VWA domain-containing protein [Bacteriovoracaceae bacterium]|nr:VWA domain-containing protein [Bacteriovoracaceae bacterium]